MIVAADFVNILELVFDARIGTLSFALVVGLVVVARLVRQRTGAARRRVVLLMMARKWDVAQRIGQSRLQVSSDQVLVQGQSRCTVTHRQSGAHVEVTVRSAGIGFRSLVQARIVEGGRIRVSVSGDGRCTGRTGETCAAAVQFGCDGCCCRCDRQVGRCGIAAGYGADGSDSRRFVQSLQTRSSALLI